MPTPRGCSPPPRRPGSAPRFRPNRPPRRVDPRRSVSACASGSGAPSRWTHSSLAARPPTSRRPRTRTRGDPPGSRPAPPRSPPSPRAGWPEPAAPDRRRAAPPPPRSRPAFGATRGPCHPQRPPASRRPHAAPPSTLRKRWWSDRSSASRNRAHTRSPGTRSGLRAGAAARAGPLRPALPGTSRARGRSSSRRATSARGRRATERRRARSSSVESMGRFRHR
jgi:hypothetical protein